MYKKGDKNTFSFLDFNQPLGLHMNPDNRWIRMADLIPWDELEDKYASLFKSKTGNVAKPFRMALGSLIIQTRYHYSDRELIEQLTENPYLQYFIGLPGYQDKAPYDYSTLALFRRRISMKLINEVNESLLKAEEDKKKTPPGGGSGPGIQEDASTPKKTEEGNKGTLILDATCAPANIRYPQDVSLLNEAREKLEEILLWFHKAYGLPLPRRDKKQARREYLNYAKKRKHTTKTIRKAVKKQLSYVRRDLTAVEGSLAEGYAPRRCDIDLLIAITKLYEQQKYMYDNKVHRVDQRIVSLRQHWVRPIVRGKATAPVEFGAKFDLSLDSNGYGRIERISFEAYNESSCLKDAAERYKERTGHYPERILADQIYRTRENRQFCKDNGIRLSGPKLGRPAVKITAEEKLEAYLDNTDRIGVERSFSLAKRCFSLGLITTKLKETQLTSISLSVFAMNLFKISGRILFAFLAIIDNCRIKEQDSGWLSLEIA